MSDGHPTKRMRIASFEELEGDGTMNMEKISGDRNYNISFVQSKIVVLVHLVGTGSSSSSGLDENLLLEFSTTGKSSANVSQMMEKAMEWLKVEKGDCDKIRVKCKSEMFGKMVNLMPDKELENAKEYEMHISRIGKEVEEKVEELGKMVDQIKKEQEEPKSEFAAKELELEKKFVDCQKWTKELEGVFERQKTNLEDKIGKMEQELEKAKKSISLWKNELKDDIEKTLEKKLEKKDMEWQAKLEAHRETQEEALGQMCCHY